jgi:hypothetical protein
MNENTNDLEIIIPNMEDEILKKVENDIEFISLSQEISNDFDKLSNGDYFIDSTNSKITIFNNIKEFDKFARNTTNPARVGHNSGDIQVFREPIKNLQLSNEQIYSLIIWCRFENLINEIWKQNSEYYYTNSYFHLVDSLTLKHCLNKGYSKELLLDAWITIIPSSHEHNDKRLEQLHKLK